MVLPLEHSNSLTPLRSFSTESGKFSPDDPIEECPEENHGNDEKRRCYRCWDTAVTFPKKRWPSLNVFDLLVIAIIFITILVITILAITCPLYEEINSLQSRTAKLEALLGEATATPPGVSTEARTETAAGGVTGALRGISLESLQTALSNQSAVIEVLNTGLTDVNVTLSTTQQRLQDQSRQVEDLEAQMNGSTLSLQDLIQNQSRQLETLDSWLRNTSSLLARLSTQMASLQERVNATESQAALANVTLENVEERMTDLQARMSSLRGDVNQTLVNVGNLNQTVRELTRATMFGSCREYLERGFTTSGVYRLVLPSTMFSVFCDMDTDGGGWLVFQRRQDGSENFYRNWTEYQRGFGSLQGEFWLGNEKLKELTSSGPMRLRVDMEDWAGNRKWAEYSSFSMAPSNQQYRLRVSGYSGNAGNALSYSNGQGFSTYDVDHDDRSDSCAHTHHGAFWYKSCHLAHPNGRYGNARDWDHVVWESSFHATPTAALRAIQLKLR